MATGTGKSCWDAKSRIDYFDIAKGIGIILVIIGHSGFAGDFWGCFIASFHMPLFFIISGMLSNLKNEKEQDTRALIEKKIRGLMIPYISFSIIYIVIYIISLCTGAIDIKDFVQSIIYMLTLYGDSTLWFLPALLLGELIFLSLLKKVGKIYPLLITLGIAAVSYIIQLLITPVWASHVNSLLITNLIDFLRVFLRGGIVSLFVAIGYYIFDIIPSKMRDSDKFNIPAFGIGIVLTAATLFLCQRNDVVDFHRLVFGNPFMFVITATIGSMGVILISMGIGRLGILSFYGKNSLIIMCSHLNFYILYVAILLAWEINNFVTRAKSYVFMFVILCATLLMETVLIIIINRFCPFILGHRSAHGRK